MLTLRKFHIRGQAHLKIYVSVVDSGKKPTSKVQRTMFVAWFPDQPQLPKVAQPISITLCSVPWSLLFPVSFVEQALKVPCSYLSFFKVVTAFPAPAPAPKNRSLAWRSLDSKAWRYRYGRLIGKTRLVYVFGLRVVLGSDGTVVVELTSHRNLITGLGVYFRSQEDRTGL